MTPEQYEEAKAISDSIKHIKDKSMQARIDALNTRRVVGATCAATGFDVMKNMQFKIVILDECSQMLEP